jgi:hypothetical protein
MPAVLSEPEIHYFSDISYRHPYHFSEGGPLPAPTTRPLYHLEAAADYMAATADMNQVVTQGHTQADRRAIAQAADPRGCVGLQVRKLVPADVLTYAVFSRW